MRLLCFAWRSASRAVRWFLVPYILYLVFYGCVSNTVSTNMITRHTCPQLHSFVYPVWFVYVHPHVTWIDQKFHLSGTISDKLHPLQDKWESFDEKHEILFKVDAVVSPVIQNVATIYGVSSRALSPYLRVLAAKTHLYYGKYFHPSVLYYGARYKYTLETTVDSLCEHAKYHTWLVLRHVNHGASRINSTYISPVFIKIRDVTCQYSIVRKLVVASRSVFRLLLEKSSRINASLQRKKDFVHSEWSNLVKFDEIRSKYIRNREEMNTVVSNILGDITESVTATAHAETAVATSFENESTDYSDEEEEEEGEEEIITYTQTHTVTITSETIETSETKMFSSTVPAESLESNVEVYQPEVSEDELVTFGSDSSQAQIDYELSYWQSKVQKTLDLAVNSLEQDFGPILAAKTEELREQISANLSALQQDNYVRYKEMSELIVSINKDSEFIQETNTTIDEPEVDRQIMRDKIANAYAKTEEAMKEVEQYLNDVHVFIMTQYYKVAQETVDVLESFADTAISDFSLRLSGLLEILQNKDDFDDAMSWSAWKSFHKVKESIFEIRDQIFDEANAYKYNARGAKVPRGLEPWAEYLGKVNFHINFLLRDNAEYLQLVRAKANVAYQQREGLTYRLKQEEKARQEQLKREREEKARQEIERQKQIEKEREEKAQKERELQEHIERERARFIQEGIERELKEKALIEEARRLEYERHLQAQVLAEEEKKKKEEIEEAQILQLEKENESLAESADDQSEPEIEQPRTLLESDKTEAEAEPTSLDQVETESTDSPEAIEEVKVKPESSEQGLEEQAPEPMVEAGEDTEFVQEAGEHVEMSGERAPGHDEL